MKSTHPHDYILYIIEQLFNVSRYFYAALYSGMACSYTHVWQCYWSFSLPTDLNSLQLLRIVRAHRSVTYVLVPLRTLQITPNNTNHKRNFIQFHTYEA